MYDSKSLTRNEWNSFKVAFTSTLFKLTFISFSHLSHSFSNGIVLFIVLSKNSILKEIPFGIVVLVMHFDVGNGGIYTKVDKVEISFTFL